MANQDKNKSESSAAASNADAKDSAKDAPIADAPKGKQWYRIKGPGGVKLNGVFYQAGAELQIAAADAMSIDGYLEAFTPESA